MPPNGEETAWSACETNGEMIAQELERGRNATGSLVQNLHAGFVPPEPANRTSWYSAIAARVSGRLRVGKPSFATTRLPDKLGRHTTGGPFHRAAHQGIGTIDSLRCCPFGLLLRSSQRKRRVRRCNGRPLHFFATSYRGIEYPP
jgi:hypothetical protein